MTPRSSPAQSPGSWLRKLIFGVIPTLALGAATEGGARLTWGPDDLLPNAGAVYLRDHPTRFWALKPGWDTGPGSRPRFTFNQRGLRDAEVADRPVPGVHRVLSLGESTTWGFGVEAGETYTEVLERDLGPGWEVVNAGVGGYTIWQSMVWLLEEGLDLGPEIVLVYHEENDFLRAGVRDPNNWLLDVTDTDRHLYERRRPWRVPLAVAYQSRAFLAARRLLQRRPPDLPVLGPGVAPTAGMARVPPEDRWMALDRMETACRAAGVQLVILHPTYDHEPDPAHLLQRFARERGLPFVDLPSLVTRVPVPEGGMFFEGVHPRPGGHRLLARLIRESLTARGILPGLG